MRGVVVTEEAEGNLSTCVADLPGWKATGLDRKASLETIREAI